MFNKKLFYLFLAVFLAGTTSFNVSMAKTGILRASVLQANETVVRSAVKTPACTIVQPENPTYNATMVAVRKKLKVAEGEIFRVKVFLKNTGNTTWVSTNSDCAGTKVALGTDRERDHESLLYSPEIKKADNNWGGANRIYMDQMTVKPGEIASFTFWAKAGNDPDIYKEYFTPVVEGLSWIDTAQFSFPVIVGDTGDDQTTIRKKLLYAGKSGVLSAMNLDGEKKVVVDLSEQKAYVSIEGNVIREFRVSTGKASTPTPPGSYSIKLKQEVRVGGEAPHYIMPKFMLFRDGGYGLHALPSLRTDRGYFWTEARAHIGIPVSHGCIRLLPEDADFLYEFADLGTKVTVQR